MNPLHIALSVIYEPSYGFRLIQRKRDKFSHLTTVALLVLIMVVRVASIYLTHYPLAPYDPSHTNIGREVLNIIVPLLTWGVSAYLVTTILSGECLLREIIQGTAFAMLPYIIFTIPIALLSKVMVASDVLFYNAGTPITIIQALTGAVWAWVGILLLMSLGHMNSYTFWETIKTALITLFTCVFLWAVLALLYILGDNVIRFIKNVVYEYKEFFFGN